MLPRKCVRRVMAGRNWTVSGSVAMESGMAVRNTVKTPKHYFKGNGEFVILQSVKNWHAGKCSLADW